MSQLNSLKNLIIKHRWLLIIMLAALILRFWHLDSLPPGVTAAEANTGLSSLALLHHGSLWSFGITPLNLAYSWLSVPFLAIGHSLVWLRLVAALAGLATVLGVYFWLRDLRGKTDGLVGAIIVATLAWALALSREAGWASLVPAIVAWALWLSGRVDKPVSKLALAALAGVSFYVSPGLWWLTLVALGYLFYRRQLTGKLMYLGIWAILLVPGLIWIGLHHEQLGQYFAITGSLHRTTQFIIHLVSTGGDWQLTAGGQPLLNAFYAIMAVLGLVVSLLRFKTSKVILLPLLAGILAGAFEPSGAGFALALVPLVGLIVIGIATMLEWWYATFPINAAARTSGRAALGLILLLAAYQGYVQYFVAFANSTQTYADYREDAWQLSTELKAHPDAIVVVDQAARTIVNYRTYPKTAHFATVKTLPVQPKAHYYIIGFEQRAAVETILASIVPGGKLRAYTSGFDGREIYYTYEVK
jgi:4-amino-4-deoxy-L-arabinose transferase-like glycosyltransferase